MTVAMEVTHNRVDLAECARQQREPCAFVERKPADHWLVSHDAIYMDRPIRWRQTIKETAVFIPMVPYLLVPEPDLALAYIFQLGVRVSVDVGRPVKRLHIVTGCPVNIVDDPVHGQMWQYYVGFGVVLAR